MAQRWARETFLALHLLLLFAAATTSAQQSDVQAVQVCGRTVALAISPDGPFDPTGPGSREMIRTATLPGLVGELDTMCRASPRQRARFARRVERIVFVRAQGATEPTPFVRDRTLVLEFFGGPYDATLFRRDLRRAIDGRPSFND